MIRGRLSDEEWAFFAPFVIEAGPLRGRPPLDHRRVLDAIFWITRTGAPWRDLPEELGNWNSVHRQFRRWTAAGLWDLMLQGFTEGGGEDALQMIDSTIVRAHHCAAGARGESEPGSWPFSRRFLDQNPPSRQREVDDEDTSITVSNIIKSLSDDAANVTIIVVGVASSLLDLMERHESIERCTEQVNMPRMLPDERRDVIDKRLNKLGMSIDIDAKWTIINLSRGLPAYVHALGKHAAFSAIDDLRSNITMEDVAKAIEEVIAASEQTLRDGYDLATRSNHAKARFKPVLTACALARCDDSGFFMPAAVREPLAAITHRSIEIADFTDMLTEFAERRGNILERTGEARAYRFRFAKPAMHPYVLMRGIQANLVGDDVKRSLSSPAQGDLFAND